MELLLKGRRPMFREKEVEDGFVDNCGFCRVGCAECGSGSDARLMMPLYLVTCTPAFTTVRRDEPTREIAADENQVADPELAT